MSTAALYSKFDLLPEHLKQQVLDYVEFLLSREGKTTPSVKDSKKKMAQKVTEKPKSRFAGRISPATARQLQEQTKNMRKEWR
jgi:Protein of unknown function (DUF2281)